MRNSNLLALCFLLAALPAQAATLTWEDMSDNEQIFRIERAPGPAGAFAEIGFVSSNVVSYSDLTGVEGNCYRVRAYNTFGNSAYSNVACIPLPLPPAGTPPVAPSNLTLSALSSSSLKATWRDSAFDEVAQNIYCHRQGAAYRQVGAVVANAQQFTVSGLRRNSLYYCRVNACNGTLCSEYSNTDSERTRK